MGKMQDMQKMLKLRKQAKSVQKKLKNIHIEATDGDITITFNGEQKAVKVDLALSDLDPKLKKSMEKSIMEAINKGIKKSQEIAAANMKDIMDQFGGMPGFGA